MKFHRVEPADWHDRPVAIVACGPSLQTFDLTRIRDTGAHVLAVKGAIFDLPWAELGFGLDLPRFKTWQERLAEVVYPIYWAFGDGVDIPLPENVRAVVRINAGACAEDTRYVVCGGTSGYGALNLVRHKGARRVCLFGYDHQAKGAQWHWNWRHYAAHRYHSRRNWTDWAINYEAFANAIRGKGMEVVNASPESLIGAFPRCTLEDGLAYLRG